MPGGGEGDVGFSQPQNQLNARGVCVPWLLVMLVFRLPVNRGEVECLIRLFDTLVSASHSRFAVAGFDRNVFRDTLHRAFGMTDDVVMDRGEVGGLSRAVALPL